MKVTAIQPQTRNERRVNVYVDGAYRLSLDLFQVADLHITVGSELDDAALAALEQESEYGKLYVRAIEWAMLRPRSERELHDYLYRKTLKRRTSAGLNEGFSKDIASRVHSAIIDKRYVSDESFARFWIESRYRTKGISRFRIERELYQKGVSRDVIEATLSVSERNDQDELQKVIARKSGRYRDRTKFIHYLQRQGFRYDDIVAALDQGEVSE